MQHQTSFETARGISDVEVSHGHALIVVTGFNEAEESAKRLEALRVLAGAGYSIDFLKLALGGFSFVVQESAALDIEKCLSEAGFDAKAIQRRSLITVRAPNIRDESGLVARIAQTVVASDASIESVGDMHSAVLLVVHSAVADRAGEALRGLIGKVDIL